MDKLLEIIQSKLTSIDYRWKLLLGLLLVSIPVLTLLTLDNEITLRNLISKRENGRVNSIGQFLSREIAANLVDKDTIEVERILELRVRQPDVLFISVVGPKNIVRYSTDSLRINKFDSIEDSPQMPKERKELFVRSFPIHSKKGVLGSLQIGYSLRSAHADLRKALIREIAMDVPLLFLTLFAAWFLSGKLHAPLMEIKSAADEIAGGNFSKRIPVVSRDILGELSERMNNMAEKLGDLTENMEQKINIATADLEISNKRLEDQNRMKSGFLGMVSHDLKSPLTSIMGFAQTLKSLDLPKEKHDRYLIIIEDECKRMHAMIDEFLDASRIETGNFSLHMERFAVRAFIEETLASMNFSPDIILVMEIISDKLELFGDRDALRRVMVNILDNAVKYGGQGTITVSAVSTLEGIRISVRDNGPGISPSDVERIFDRFYRAWRPTNKKTGTGLGLAIVKDIVELHKGRVWCDSEIGKGTTISFALPFSRP